MSPLTVYGRSLKLTLGPRVEAASPGASARGTRENPVRCLLMTASRRRAGALLFLSAATLATPAVAAAQQAPAVVSLEAALPATREHTPDLLPQRNDRVAAHAATRAARADFIPSASAQADLGYTASGVQRFGAEEFGE